MSFKFCTNESAATHLRAILRGDVARIRGISSFPNSSEDAISYLAGVNDGQLQRPPGGSTVIARTEMTSALLAAGYSVIESDHPKYALARVFQDLLDVQAEPAVHPSAVIGPDVMIGDGVSIGPGSVLDGEIALGNHVRIGANNVITGKVVVEEFVRIRNGCVIGEDAYSFGFAPDGPGHGQSIRFPSRGRVVIESHAEIGNNCVISRGIEADTILRTWSRVNDLSHIGNTVELGQNSMVMANCDISARVRIGKGCWIAQSSAILQGISVGDGAQVGMGAVVTRDVPAGKVVTGVPARVHRDRLLD